MLANTYSKRYPELADEAVGHFAKVYRAPQMLEEPLETSHGPVTTSVLVCFWAGPDTVVPHQDLEFLRLKVFDVTARKKETNDLPVQTPQLSAQIPYSFEAWVWYSQFKWLVPSRSECSLNGLSFLDISRVLIRRPSSAQQGRRGSGWALWWSLWWSLWGLGLADSQDAVWVTEACNGERDRIL